MRFSIITATKNNKPGLLRTIECVRNQTYKNVEHIIVDGGSTDGTKEILREVNPANSGAQNDSLPTTNHQLPTPNLPTGQAGYQPLTTHYSLLAISEADSGIYDAINKGIKLATGDVIGLLHSDDLYADENVIEKYALAFNQPTTNYQPAYRPGRLPTIDAVYSDLVYVRHMSDVQKLVPNLMRDQKSEGIESTTTNHQLPTTYSTIRYWRTHKSVSSNQSLVNSLNTDHHSLITDNLLRNGWMPPHPTLFIRKEIFEKYGYYRTDMKIAADYEMILRLLYKHKITAHYLPQTTYLMTIGGASNKSFKNILQKSKEDYQAMKINGINSPLLTLISKNLRKLPQFLAHDVL